MWSRICIFSAASSGLVYEIQEESIKRWDRPGMQKDIAGSSKARRKKKREVNILQVMIIAIR